MMDGPSERNLIGVHPDLAKVMRGALQSPQPFRVIAGLRMLGAEEAAVASGHSQTLHSRHFANKLGFGCAVDVAALVDGEISFEPGHETGVFGTIAAQVKASALALGIVLQWGGEPIGAWTPGVTSHFRDWGHFQLPWEEYP